VENDEGISCVLTVIESTSFVSKLQQMNHE